MQRFDTELTGVPRAIPVMVILRASSRHFHVFECKNVRVQRTYQKYKRKYHSPSFYRFRIFRIIYVVAYEVRTPCRGNNTSEGLLHTSVYASIGQYDSSGSLQRTRLHAACLVRFAQHQVHTSPFCKTPYYCIKKVFIS